MRAPAVPYPRKGSGLIHQCAWCGRVVDAAGRYAVQVPYRISQASHGICPDCKASVRAELDEDGALHSR